MCLLLLILLLLLSQNKCEAQNYSAPSFGFRTYSGFGGGGGGGTANSNASFNGGYSGLNPQQVKHTNVNNNYNRNYSLQHSGSTMASLEQTLNAVDNNSGWANTPVSNAAPQQRVQKGQGYSNNGNMYPAQMNSGRRGMFPGVSKQEMLRVFLEGGTPQMNMGGGGTGGSMGGGMTASPAKDFSTNVSTAYSNYQVAVNEETKSRNYANTARYNSDQWTRKNSASQAEYAANNANYAAQRAESASYCGDSKAQGYANLARQAANRARANANRARYNADTIR